MLFHVQLDQNCMGNGCWQLGLVPPLLTLRDNCLTNTHGLQSMLINPIKIVTKLL